MNSEVRLTRCTGNVAQGAFNPELSWTENNPDLIPSGLGTWELEYCSKGEEARACAAPGEQWWLASCLSFAFYALHALLQLPHLASHTRFPVKIKAKWISTVFALHPAQCP